LLLVVGPNGAGKTNLLESLHVGTQGFSPRTRADAQLVRFGERAGRKEDQHDAFDPPYTTLNVGLIHGGTAKNVLAGECRFTLEWRPIPTQSSEHLIKLLTDAIEAESKTDPDIYVAVDASRQDMGFETSPDSALVKLMENLTGIESGTVAFGTEASQMMALGAEAVVLGPGDIREAHRTGEFVPIDELERCVEILKHAVILCEGNH